LSDSVGPQGLPKTYAVVLGALSLVLIFKSWKTRPSVSGHRVPIMRVAGMIVIGAVYLAVVPWIGYILALAGLIAATTYYQGGGLNGRVALVALSGAVFFWILFVAVLGIPHPPGIWPSLF